MLYVGTCKQRVKGDENGKEVGLVHDDREFGLYSKVFWMLPESFEERNEASSAACLKIHGYGNMDGAI